MCQLELFTLYQHLLLFSFQRAVKEYVMTVDATYGKQFDEFFVGFEGSFGSKHVTPRSLSARFLGNLVCLEGIVTKCEYALETMRTVN